MLATRRLSADFAASSSSGRLMSQMWRIRRVVAPKLGEEGDEGAVRRVVHSHVAERLLAVNKTIFAETMWKALFDKWLASRTPTTCSAKSQRVVLVIAALTAAFSGRFGTGVFPSLAPYLEDEFWANDSLVRGEPNVKYEEGVGLAESLAKASEAVSTIVGGWLASVILVGSYKSRLIGILAVVLLVNVAMMVATWLGTGFWSVLAPFVFSAFMEGAIFTVAMPLALLTLPSHRLLLQALGDVSSGLGGIIAIVMVSALSTTADLDIAGNSTSLDVFRECLAGSGERAGTGQAGFWTCMSLRLQSYFLAGLVCSVPLVLLLVTPLTWTQLGTCCARRYKSSLVLPMPPPHGVAAAADADEVKDMSVLQASQQLHFFHRTLQRRGRTKGYPKGESATPIARYARSSLSSDGSNDSARSPLPKRPRFQDGTSASEASSSCNDPAQSIADDKGSDGSGNSNGNDNDSNSNNNTDSNSNHDDNNNNNNNNNASSNDSYSNGNSKSNEDDFSSTSSAVTSPTASPARSPVRLKPIQASGGTSARSAGGEDKRQKQKKTHRHRDDKRSTNPATDPSSSQETAMNGNEFYDASKINSPVSEEAVPAPTRPKLEPQSSPAKSPPGLKLGNLEYHTPTHKGLAGTRSSGGKRATAAGPTVSLKLVCQELNAPLSAAHRALLVSHLTHGAHDDSTNTAKAVVVSNEEVRERLGKATGTLRSRKINRESDPNAKDKECAGMGQACRQIWCNFDFVVLNVMESVAVGVLETLVTFIMIYQVEVFGYTPTTSSLSNSSNADNSSLLFESNTIGRVPASDIQYATAATTVIAMIFGIGGMFLVVFGKCVNPATRTVHCRCGIGKQNSNDGDSTQLLRRGKKRALSIPSLLYILVFSILTAGFMFGMWYAEGDAYFFWCMLVSMQICGFGVFCAMRSLIIDMMPEEHYALAYSQSYFFTTMLGSTTGPLIWGLIAASAIGQRGALLVFAFFPLLLVPLAVVLLFRVHCHNTKLRQKSEHLLEHMAAAILEEVEERKASLRPVFERYCATGQKTISLTGLSALLVDLLFEANVLIDDRNSDESDIDCALKTLRLHARAVAKAAAADLLGPDRLHGGFSLEELSFRLSEVVNVTLLLPAVDLAAVPDNGNAGDEYQGVVVRAGRSNAATAMAAIEEADSSESSPLNGTDLPV